MEKSKKKNLFKKINSWFRNIMLDDVDKEYNVYLSNYKSPKAKKNPVDRIERRFDEQKKSIG